MTETKVINFPSRRSPEDSRLQPVAARLSYRFPGWEVTCGQMDDGKAYVAAALRSGPGYGPHDGFAASWEGDQWVITDGDGTPCAHARRPDLYAAFAAILEHA